MVHLKVAYVDQLAPNKIPIMSVGDLTPGMLLNFQVACRLYLSHHQDIPPEEQVEKVAWGIQDLHI